MARKPKTEAAAETSTELALFAPANPVVVVTDQKEAEKLFTHIEQEIAAFTPDLTTDAGRRAIASLAYKVSRTKTAITSAAEELIEAERKKVNDTVAERKRIEQRLDDLRDLARKPLTEWEEAEELKRKAYEQAKAELADAQIVRPEDTAQSLRVVVSQLEAGTYAPESYGEDNAATLDVLAKNAVAVLKGAIARLEEQEREKAELEQLRQEKAERDRQEAARLEQERQAREAEEARQREAEEAQRREDEARLAAEQEEERKRLEAEEEQRRIEAAQEAAQLEERRRADEALAEQQRQAQAEIDAANRRAQEAEERAARERQEREAEEKRIAEEKAAREADQENRRKRKTDAKNAIMSCGADEQTARNIVLSIVAGEVPNVTFNF